MTKKAEKTLKKPHGFGVDTTLCIFQVEEALIASHKTDLI